MEDEIKFEFVSRVQNLPDFGVEGSPYRLPERSTKNSAGYDFYNIEKIDILPEQKVYVKTGIKAKFPSDIGLFLLNRSSNPMKKDLVLINGIGLVDADYYNNPDNEGEIIFAFMNISADIVTISPNEKLGQGVFLNYYTVTDEGNIDKERTGGFGSTGL